MVIVHHNNSVIIQDVQGYQLNEYNLITIMSNLNKEPSLQFNSYEAIFLYLILMTVFSSA